MTGIPRAIFMTPDELDQRIRDLTVEAHHLEDSEERQAILKEIALLRQHADMKRWIESPGPAGKAASR
jgi:hypothetical protein